MGHALAAWTGDGQFLLGADGLSCATSLHCTGVDNSVHISTAWQRLSSAVATAGIAVYSYDSHTIHKKK